VVRWLDAERGAEELSALWSGGEYNHQSSSCGEDPVDAPFPFADLGAVIKPHETLDGSSGSTSTAESVF